MQLKAFTIPVHDDGVAIDEVNAFLRSHRVLAVDCHFVQDGANSVWAICVSYLGDQTRPQAIGAKRPKVDYREVLSDADFALFARLRAMRKQMADREGVPAYALFTNALMAVSEFLLRKRCLDVKLPAVIVQSKRGVSFCGFRVLPGAILLSRRRRQRYAAACARWERAFQGGLIDARGLQAGYAFALGMTAAADALVWRRMQLQPVPLGAEVADV